MTFESAINPSENLLPYNGILINYGQLFEYEESMLQFNKLRENCPWQQDRIQMFGKEIVTKREVCWYGNDGLTYTYSGRTKEPLSWSSELLEIKSKVEEITAESYNSCLLNLYHNGSEGMGWHADNEKELKPKGAIASVSLGASRRFVFKHRKTGDKVEILLESGNLLLMKGDIQEHWLHSLPVMKRVSQSRINLTFRTIISR